MNGQVEIYHTTLRDGTQGEGINFTAQNKIRIAEKLDSFVVHYFESGRPGSNPRDIKFFQQAVRRKWKNAQIAAFSMTRRKGIPVESDQLMRLILEAMTPAVAIVGKTWLLHWTKVRVRVGEELALDSAEGDGPVSALHGALRRALVTFSPSLNAIGLTDYRTRLVNGTAGAPANTRALIKFSNGKCD